MRSTQSISHGLSQFKVLADKRTVMVANAVGLALDSGVGACMEISTDQSATTKIREEEKDELRCGK
jgi:hypothetical protein